MAVPPSIAVIDLGSGNLRSVTRALCHAGLAPEVTGDPNSVRRADGVVLPGVGNFARAATNLRAKGLDEALLEVLDAGRPYLGICLGLQLLFQESDEDGLSQGLGFLAGRVERFSEHDPSGARRRVPHIGWNEVRFSGSHPMLEGLPEQDHYYFVHAYRALPANDSWVVGSAAYGEEFAAALATPGVFAVQFHPEKSQRAGLRLMSAYARWVASCA